jgi:tRNA (guanine-N(7)-)-methyltransferase subunit TRM82
MDACRFVSALCIPSTHPDILFSAGGDPHILIHQISTGNLLGRIAIAETVKPYRTVRASMRRVRKKGFKAEVNVPAGSTAQQTDQETQQRELPLPGQMPYTDEQWMSVPDGWGLPAGEGICITKMENLGDSVVFFSEG